MAIQIDKILSFTGNKYEITSAMSKYARYLFQKNDEDLEIPINRTQKEKVATIAINDMLNDKVSYRIEVPVDENGPDTRIHKYFLNEKVGRLINGYF